MAPSSLALKVAALAFFFFASSVSAASNDTTLPYGTYYVPPCTFTTPPSTAPSVSASVSSSTSGYPLLYTPPASIGGSSIYANSSGPYAAQTSDGVKYTTSTVYTTTFETITSCAPTVTDCPVSTVTKIYALYTTVCPVSPSATSGSGSGVVFTYSALFSTIALVPTEAASSPGSAAGTGSLNPSSSGSQATGGASRQLRMEGSGFAAVVVMAVGVMFL